MAKNLFKLLTLAIFMTSVTQAFERSNPVFSQLKNDMWNMGMEFDYVHGDKIVSPRMNTDTKEGQPQLRTLQIEEITRALNI